MTTRPSTGLVDFALHTSDARWIRRHNGRADEAGRVIVQVPAIQIDAVKIAGNDMLRHRFADCPRDAANPSILCPAKWVPASADLFTFERETGIPPQVAEFMRQHAGKRR
jgi:hypothetical protein